MRVRMKTMMFLLQLLFLFRWVGGEGGEGECNPPDQLAVHCTCQDSVLECSNLSSTKQFLLFKTTQITGLTIQTSNIKCLDLAHFSEIKNIVELNIVGSNIHHFCNQDGKVRIDKDAKGLDLLQSLDLSGNRIHKFDQILSLPALRSLNLSSNWLTRMPRNLGQELEILDLSFNRLPESITKEDFYALPKTLKFLSIKGNRWNCSPLLSWLYPWSLTLPSTLRISLEESNCRIENTERTAPLLTVMQIYHSDVLPACPDVCSCTVYHFGSSTLNTLSYTLKVNCSGQNLIEFPSVPLHTTILDLSNNKLEDKSFHSLDIVAANYQDISGLNLSNNRLTLLDNKLLKMKLHRYLKAMNNRLTEIPYDISLMLQRYDTDIYLGNNPWKCFCKAEINSVNLWTKLSDLRDVTCSPDSQPDSIHGLKVQEIDPLILCPLPDAGHKRELGLRLLCACLAVCIVVVLAKLGYDYYQYKNIGKLPWLVLRMP